MNKNRIFKDKITPRSIIAILLLLVSAMAIFALYMWEKHQKSIKEDNVEEITIRYDGNWYVEKKHIETVLILGLDKYDVPIDETSYNNDKQADFIMLLVMDNKAKTCTPIHINRDTMAKMDILGVTGQSVGSTTAQLALSHTYGSGGDDSCRNSAKAVSSVLYDIRIDHYVSLTMDSMVTINDLVGGVTLTVLDDLTPADSTLVKDSEVTLKGDHALNYIRSRYGLEDSSNIRRMARQRQYMNALYKKIMQRIDEDENFFSDTASTFVDSIYTDYSAAKISDILDSLPSYKLEDIRTIEGDSVLGEAHMEFYPDEEALQKMIIELFYDLKS